MSILHLIGWLVAAVSIAAVGAYIAAAIIGLPDTLLDSRHQTGSDEPETTGAGGGGFVEHFGARM